MGMTRAIHVALLILSFQTILMRNVNSSKTVNDTKKIINTNEEIGDYTITSLNDVITSEEPKYHFINDLKENEDPIERKLTNKRNGRLLRRKVLKKKLKPGQHLLKTKHFGAYKSPPVQTLQQMALMGNLSIPQITEKPRHGQFYNGQDFSKYFENKLEKNPLIGEDIFYSNSLGYKSFGANVTGSNVSRSNPKSFIGPLDKKRTPKRFFGGFLFGAVTTLEAAVKVNIPIPFCQFPNSPCKRNSNQYVLLSNVLGS